MTPATAELKTEAELAKLNRADLDKYAKEHDVDPGDHSNMKSLLAAVPSRDETDEERSEREGRRPGASRQSPATQDGSDADRATGGTDTSTAIAAEDEADVRTDVEKQRDKQLDAGRATGKAREFANRLKDATPAEQRSRKLGVHPIEGRVDNMTRRSDADVLTGHFCRIDYGEMSKAERAAVESIVGEGGTGVGRADYGVFTEAATFDDDGYPLTANVLLRDEHSAMITVPYDALVPAQAGGR